MKISFDFDCTLSEDWVQSLFITLCESGHDVYVITSRNDDSPGVTFNRDLWEVTKN